MERALNITGAFLMLEWLLDRRSHLLKALLALGVVDEISNLEDLRRRRLGQFSSIRPIPWLGMPPARARQRVLTPWRRRKLRTNRSICCLRFACMATIQRRLNGLVACLVQMLLEEFGHSDVSLRLDKRVVGESPSVGRHRGRVFRQEELDVAVAASLTVRFYVDHVALRMNHV